MKPIYSAHHTIPGVLLICTIILLMTAACVTFVWELAGYRHPYNFFAVLTPTAASYLIVGALATAYYETPLALTCARPTVHWPPTYAELSHMPYDARCYGPGMPYGPRPGEPPAPQPHQRDEPQGLLP